MSATANKIIHGAYHFAHPDVSTGAVQATYFLAHGGKWIADGLTLPGAIDLEGAALILFDAKSSLFLTRLYSRKLLQPHYVADGRVDPRLFQHVLRCDEKASHHSLSRCS